MIFSSWFKIETFTLILMLYIYNILQYNLGCFWICMIQIFSFTFSVNYFSVYIEESVFIVMEHWNHVCVFMCSNDGVLVKKLYLSIKMSVLSHMRNPIWRTGFTVYNPSSNRQYCYILIPHNSKISGFHLLLKLNVIGRWLISPLPWPLTLY